MEPELKELARALASLSDDEFREVTEEARGPLTHQRAKDRKAKTAADMSRKASQLAGLIQQSYGF